MRSRQTAPFGHVRFAVSFGLVLVASGILAACDQPAPVGPEETSQPQFSFTNGPSAPNLVVYRNADATFLFGTLFHWNFASDGIDLPGAGQARPLIVAHYLDPFNHPIDGCGDDSSPDETVELQSVSTPSEVQRVLELYRDRASPVSVYEGLFSEWLADPCGFFATRLVAEGTVNFTGQFQLNEDGPTRIGGNWQGTLDAVPSGKVRLNEEVQILFKKDGSVVTASDVILLRPVGN